MDTPKVTDAHEKLERLVGTWVGAEQLNPSPWDPEGGPAEGRVENRRALDGFAVVQDYTQTRNGAVSYRGHGVFGWDAARGVYTMHWWDSMGSPVNTFEGTFEGDVLTLSFAGAQGHHRTTMTFSGSDGYSFEMDVSPDGDQWYPFMSGTYSKRN